MLTITTFKKRKTVPATEQEMNNRWEERKRKMKYQREDERIAAGERRSVQGHKDAKGVGFMLGH